MSGRLTLTSMIAGGMLDAELAALLWQLADAGVPLVTASRDAAAAEQLRGAIGDLVDRSRAPADGALAGGVVVGDSLEDLLRLGGGGADANPEGGVPDGARELGVVAIVAATPGGRRVTAAHYVRPVERDAQGHLQRRPPALLAAWDEGGARFDHFDWGVTDELATRAAMTTNEFERLHRRRARLLADLAAAGVFDADDLRRQVGRVSLASTEPDGALAADAPH